MIRLRSDYARLGMPLAFIPNTHGFRFIGWTHDHRAVPCRVVRGEDGLHRVEGCDFEELLGWFHERKPAVVTPR